MAKLTKLPGMEIIDGFKGVIDFYLWNGIPCARSWPRSPGSDRAPAVKEQWPAFAFAGSYWNNLALEVKQAYIDMAAGYPITGRDLFTQSFINGRTVVLD